MARLINDGPGYQFLQKNCAVKHYAVCNYLDRLPTQSEDFLWSLDPSKGVYNLVDVPTRKALSAEQFAFVADVFRSDPAGVLVAAIKNTVRQFESTELRQFFHTPEEVEAYRHFLPGYYFNQLLHSRIVEQMSILPPLNILFFSIYIFCVLFLILALLFWPLVKFKNKTNIFPRPEWTNVLAISIFGIALNAAICGALSIPSARYQARVAWIPLFVVLVIAAKLWQAFFDQRISAAKNFNEMTEGLPRPAELSRTHEKP
jgi:hypothetical protein